MKDRRKQEAPRAKKTAKERKLRHQSRIARPRPPTVRNGRVVDKLDDDRAWMMDW